jgi:hypothetical protein
MPLDLIKNNLFYVSNSVTYPPFKNGYYLEEYFFEYMRNNKLEENAKGRRYIPALWTNFQIEDWFKSKKDEMQSSLDEYIKENPSEHGYFTVVQYDDGPLLRLPEDTVVYGACSGTIPLPLIYEDRNNTLVSVPNRLEYKDKELLCSFVGTITHNVRGHCLNILSNKKGFEMYVRNGWSTDVNEDLQKIFIENTIRSKFALAPRGYGRSSFRFFEIFQLGSVPVYIWDDIEWLPYKDKIDYKKICISIHISEICHLESILNSITEEQYNGMVKEYDRIKRMFGLEEMCKYVAPPPIKISLCITTMDRFDDFLSTNLDKYLDYLLDDLIDEIIICDENGNDYKKIVDKYEKQLKETPNFKVYKNEERLGVFKNKLRACSYASNEYIALIDSDNFPDATYFKTAKKYIEENKLSNTFILSPCIAKTLYPCPNLDYRELKNKVITTENIRHYLPNFKLQVLLNTGNYIISKSITDNIQYNNDIMDIISGCDVIYFNYLTFLQFPNMELHIVEGLEYEHTVHDDGGEYNKRHPECDYFKYQMLMPSYYSLHR